MAQFFRRKWPGVSYGRGENWHYVGGSGEPAFENSWTTNTGQQALAFRIRESGIVDIHGVAKGSSATGAQIFTLPVGYRPSTGTVQMVWDSGGSAVEVDISAAGAVALTGITNKVYFSLQLFLTMPNNA